MMDGSGYGEQRPTRWVYKGGKSQANIEHLGAVISLLTKRWHPRQDNDNMDGRGRGYWSSLAGFIYHGRRFFFAVPPPSPSITASCPPWRVGAWGFFFTVSIYTPIRFNQFVSLLASFPGQHNTQHDRRGYRMTG